MGRAFVSALVFGLFLIASSLFATTTAPSLKNQTSLAPASERAANPGASIALGTTNATFEMIAAETGGGSPCVQPEVPKVHGQTGNKRRFVNPMVPCRPATPRPVPHA
jgi:hypothetical protein